MKQAKFFISISDFPETATHSSSNMFFLYLAIDKRFPLTINVETINHIFVSKAIAISAAAIAYVHYYLITISIVISYNR